MSRAAETGKSGIHILNVNFFNGKTTDVSPFLFFPLVFLGTSLTRWCIGLMQLRICFNLRLNLPPPCIHHVGFPRCWPTKAKDHRPTKENCFTLSSTSLSQEFSTGNTPSGYSEQTPFGMYHLARCTSSVLLNQEMSSISESCIGKLTEALAALLSSCTAVSHCVYVQIILPFAFLPTTRLLVALVVKSKLILSSHYRILKYQFQRVLPQP